MTEHLKFLGGTTNENSFEYQERKKYLDYFRSKDYRLLDTLYEKKLYGFLNKKGHVVMPTKTITRFGEDTGSLEGLNYVVDCFNYMRTLYRENNSIIVPEKISDFVPKRNYEDFEGNYQIYEQIFLERITPILEETLHGEKVSLLKFVETLENLIFSSELSDYPMTKSGFALSIFSTAYTTGLYIDLLASEDASIDFDKPEILEDENFECFVKLAQENGFLVDANCPWRLVLDLESDIVKHKILNGRPLEEFDKFYYDVYNVNVGYDDYWALRSFCQKLFVEYYRTNNYELPSMPRLEHQDRWLEFLITNRFRELSIIKKPNQKSLKKFTDVLKRAKQTNSIYGLTNNCGALGYLNDFFGSVMLERIGQNENSTNAGYREQLQRNFLHRLESI